MSRVLASLLAVAFVAALVSSLVPALESAAHADGFHRTTGRAMAGNPLTDPPQITIDRASPNDDPGYVFVAPKLLEPGTAQGPEIVDDRGRAVWFDPMGTDQQAWNFQEQRYRGKPVLTWWQGASHSGVGYGEGEDVIMNTHYKMIATVHASSGYQADGHEFTITPQGTALIDIYHAVPYDLSSLGGPTNGQVLDCIIQEIDIATGKVLFTWHSLDHVPLSDSEQPPPALDATTNAQPYDYFHINSVQLAADGNLLVSARHMWAIYEIDRHTGDIVWTLGGKHSDFKLGKGVEFEWQHNAMAAGPDTIRIFDNHDGGGSSAGPSRVIWVRLDRKHHTATLVKQIVHPDKIAAASQGNAEALPDGHTFVGWGQTGRVSEFDRNGKLLFDAQVQSGYDTYRGFRFVWHGQPATPPTATVTRDADGSLDVSALWNGATRVARWRVLAGPARGHLPSRAGSFAWNGLDTTVSVSVPSGLRFLDVAALDRQGRVIGRSRPVAIPEISRGWPR